MVKIETHNNKLVKYRRSLETEKLTGLLYTQYVVNLHKEMRGGVEKDVADPILPADEEYLYIPKSIIRNVVKNIRSLGYEVDYTETDNVFNKLSGDSIERLESYYITDCDKLIDGILELGKYKNGIINLPTGWGKSWMMLGIVRLFLENTTDGNVLVLAPGSNLVDELNERYQFMNIGDLGANRTRIINILSLRAHNLYSEENIKWFNNVKLVLIDECESIPGLLVKLLDEHLIGYEYIYGLSASPDKYKGNPLSEDSINFPKLDLNTWNNIKYLGFSILHRSPDKLVGLNILNSTFNKARYFEKAQYNNHKWSIDAVVNHPNIIKLIEFATSNSRDSLYIPINSIGIINKIVSKLHIPYITWNAAQIYCSNNPEVNTRSKLRDYMRDVSKYDRPRVVFSTSTSYRGISIPELTDILLISSSQYNTVIQTIGRTFRSEYPVVWIPREVEFGKNKIFFYSSKKREKVIKEVYKVAEYNVFNLT